MQRADQLDEAYGQCLALARRHYENFPVASRLLPRRLRRPVAVIYAFARTADDFADEGDLPSATRLAKLDAYRDRLDALAAGATPQDPIFLALADVVHTHGLPLAPFYDLLTAFRMDVGKPRYADFGELMHYCRHSANPVGRLLLHLYGAASERNLAYSDAVCSALQLINFLQDLNQDYTENNRIYLPQDEMARFGVGEAHLRERRTDAAMLALMRFQIQRARQLLYAGAPLGRVLRGRIGFELRLIVAGGARILRKLEQRPEDAFSRPRLRPPDWGWMLWKALRAR